MNIRRYSAIGLLGLGLGACATKPVMKSAAAQVEGPGITTTAFTVRGISADAEYGYSEKKPICVSDGKNISAGGEYEYLKTLAGPNGETLRYRRLGHCCPFKTPRGMLDNTGLLDRYEVSWAGADKPVILYLNMYDPAPDRSAVPVPQGLTLKQP